MHGSVATKLGTKQSPKRHSHSHSQNKVNHYIALGDTWEKLGTKQETVSTVRAYLSLLVSSQLKVLTPFQGHLFSLLALVTLHPQDNLLGGSSPSS